MEKLVNSLDDFGRDGDHSEILRQIHQFFENLTDFTKIDQHLDFSFPDNGGILGFLRSRITVKNTDKAREQAFELIIFLVQNPHIPKHILQPYCLKFKEIADLTRKNLKERARIQSIALECLQAILENFGSTLGATDLDASELYWSLLRDSEKSAFQPSVRGKMLHILGLLSRLYAHDFMEKERTYNQLFNHLVSCLKAQVDSSSSHMEAAILLGAVKGLDQFLLAFQSKINPQNSKMVELYEKLEQIIDPKCSIEHDKATLKLKRREFQRAGLELVANHGNIFQQNLYDHYEQWFWDLLSWARSNNMDDLRAGMKAIFKFLEVICTFIHSVQNDDDDAKVNFREKLLNFFTATFRVILDNKECHKSELTIAIRGIGLIVDVCNDSEMKDQLFTKILKHVENIISEFSLPDRDKYSRSASLIPTYLESLGNMLFSTKILDESSLLTFQNRLGIIEQLSGLLVSHYADLGEKYRRSAPYAFLKVIRSLYTAHFKWFQTFLENIVCEGLRQIISCPTQVEVDILIESYQRANQVQGVSGNSEKEKKAVGNKLGLKTLQSYIPFWNDLVNIRGGGNQVEVSSLIYDAVIQWVLITIARLDLSIEFLDDEDEDNVTVTVALEESVAYPMYNTKANVARDFQLFVNLVEFLQEFTRQTPSSYFTEHWIEIFLSEMLNYVETHPFVSGFYKIVCLVFDIMRETQYFKTRQDSATEKIEVFHKASGFLKSLASKIQEYRDDLLLSVLNVWLSAPNEVIVENLQGLSITLKIIFQTGRTCFPIALRGIEAVERWFEINEFPFDIMENLFQNLFPIWKSYFTYGGIENLDKTLALSKKNPKSKSKLTQRKLNRMRIIQLDDTTLNTLQLSILKLIGSYGHFLNVDGEENDHGKIKMCMEEKFLKYAVPFQDIKPDLYLDSILPRILNLCQYGASERQVRSSACECFHTLVLYFLGHSVHTSNRETHSELFQKIFISIIKLGSDSDIIVRQLFNPLTIQIIHWYTRGGAGEYSEIILHTIMDSLAQTEDSSLRDFATVCISEYFSWSLKHSDLQKVKVITKTLSAMSTHAAPKYRQGSVLAFNSIYREFRENDSLVNKYTFLFTYSYIVSLGLPSEFGEESILIKSTTQALRHLERIILKKKNYFNTPIRGRKLPAEFSGSCLKHLVDWILDHSVKAEIIGRDECLRLVSILAPNIRDIGTLETYLYKYQEEKYLIYSSNSKLISMIENLLIQQNNSEDTHEYFLKQLKSLTASADIYEFFLTAGVGVEKLLQSNESKFIKNCSKIFECHSTCFEKYPNLSLRFFTKFGSIISKSNQILFDYKIRNKFLITSMILSKEIGIVGKYRNIIFKLVTFWLDLLPVGDYNNKLKEDIKVLVTLNFEIEMNVKQINEMCKAIEWLQVLANTNFFINILSPQEIIIMNNNIWEFIQVNLFRVGRHNNLEVKQRSIRMEELLQNILILALDLGIQGNKIIEAIFNPTIVISRDKHNIHKLTKGEIFQTVLLPALCYCDELLNFKKLIENISIEQVGSLIQNLLNIVKNKRLLRKRFGTKLVEMTLTIWRPLHLNCDPQIIAKVISGLASLNMELCRNSIELSDWWSGTKMMTSTHLNLKEKAEFIHFFALFALSHQNSIVNNVIDSMDELVKQNLNPRPSLKWSQEEIYFTQIFLKLISVYEEIPENNKLLKTLVHFVTKATILRDMEEDAESTARVKTNGGVTQNSCGLEIQKMLKKVIENNNTTGNENITISIAETILDMILDDKLIYCRTNRVPSKFCLIPVLASMAEKTARRFYRNNIRRIIKIAESPATTILEFNCKTTAFLQLEMLALKTTADFIKGTELNNNYQEQKSKENQDGNVCSNSQTTTGKDLVVLKTILAACQNMRRSPVPIQRDDNLRYANFLCNGSAFNAMAAILKATNSEEKFYTGFIFFEKPGNTTGGIWANLIDSTVTYTFPVILDPTLAKKIRVEKTNTTSEIETKIKNGVQTDQNQKIVLTESSLALDATKYDFTSAVKVATNEFYRLIHSGEASGHSRSLYTDPGQFMEWNALNEHECMLALVQSIRKMKTFKFSDDFPVWTKELVAQLKKPNIHGNIQAFLIGAIINCEDVFQPYAHKFIEPIIDTILKNCFQTSGTGTMDSTENLNHFVKDIIVVLLGWFENSKPNINSAKKLFEFYINRIDYHRKDVFEHNLQILQTMVKRWGFIEEEYTIPYEMVIENLKKSDQRLGLNVCKAILLGGQLPCPVGNMPNFIDTLSMGFTSTVKTVYSLTGEVCGLLLKHLEVIQFKFLDNATSRLKEKKLVKEKGRLQPFLIMLECIHSNYPKFLLLFKNELIGLVKITNIQSQVLVLLVHILNVELSNEVEALKRKELASSLFADLEGRGIFRTEWKHDSDCISGVELLNLLIQTDFVQNEAKMKQLINWTQIAEHSGDPTLRARYALAVSNIYTHFGGHKSGSEISTKSEKMFIRLYKDEDPTVLEVVNDFWSKNLKSWTNSPSLILELMETLGDDPNAIPVSLDLILKRCSLSPDFGKMIFDKALAECQFINYELDTSWRLQNFSFQPLFAESLSMSQNFSLLPPAIQSTVTQRRVSSQFGMNILRATLNNLQFTPTKGNNSSLEDSQLVQPMEIDSFENNRFPSQQVFRSEIEEVAATTNEITSSSRNSLENLRKRFYERPESHVFARREVERQQVIVETQVEEHRRRRSGVRLARSYRIGELPDIMIKHSEFLTTISALAKMDEEMGMIFLIHLFTSIVKEIGSGSEPIRLRNFRYNATLTFDKLFKNYGSQLSPKFAAAILEISILNHISIKVNLVSNISRTFDLQVIGILKLEQDLENSIQNSKSIESHQSKKPRMDGQGSIECTDLWLRIGELYKELDNFDTVRSVFFHIHNQSEDETEKCYFNKAREALYFESLGKYRESLDRYDILYTEESERTDPNLLLLQFWDDALYKVMAYLSDWNESYRKSHESYLLHANELNNENYRDRVLPHQIVSGLQILLREKNDDENVENFKTFLTTIKKNDEEWKELIENFPLEFAILSQIEEETMGKSSALIDSAWTNAVKSFQFYEKLSISQKKNQILELQKVSILSDSMDWMKCCNVSISNIEERTTKLINKWRRSCFSTTSPLLTADFIITQRNYFLGKASEKVDSLIFDEKDALLNEINRLYFEQNLWVVQMATLNGNAEVGNGYLRKAKNAGEGLKAKKLLLLAQLLTSCEYTPDVWTRQWSTVWRTIPRLKMEDPSILWKVQSELLLSLILSQSILPPDCEERLRNTLLIPPGGNLMKTVIQNSIHLVGKATGEEDEQNQQNILSITSNASPLLSEDVSMKLYHLLKTILEKFPNEYKCDEILHRRLLLSLIHGMKSGHSDALHFFPTCFPWLETFPTLMKIFMEHMKDIQSWMFLPWLDQIVTNYRHNFILAPMLKPIIDRLITDYPQAFQLQYADLFEKSTQSILMSNYKKALLALVLPQKLFENRITSLSSNARNRSMLKKELMSLLIDLEKIQINVEFYGRIHQDYVNEIIPNVKDKLKSLEVECSSDETSQSQDLLNCEKISTDISTLLKHNNTMKKNIYEPMGKKLKSYLNLKDLSPWLDKFHFAGFKDEIEIPGLYTQFRKPDTSLHSKIVSFEPTVKVYTSKSIPLRLTMMANNGKKYYFLVKHGDDLRQDKRIQQLFDLSNEILKKDPQCRQRALGILTYPVIPITLELGMIEMVVKTESLKGFIFNSASKIKKFEDSRLIYHTWIMSCWKESGRPNPAHQYGRIAMKSRSEVEGEFNKVVASLPPKLLRNNVENSIGSLELYFALRDKLIRSYATMSLIHWLLGIGDRHLENCLISLESGQFLGIDFGYAFGTGTAQLHVPELMPFRLTPQLQDFLVPYGEKGLFKETMMYTWRALVKSSKLLTSVAEVFVKEPTVTWCRRITNKTDEDSIMPIDVLKEKLKGSNPIRILARLLQVNQYKNYLGHWTKVIEDGRGTLTFQEKLIDEDLIDLLLCLACDKNVLGRAYIGWSSWV